MNQNEYNQCVDQHSDDLYRFVLKSIKDREMARDIVQHAFAVLWEKRGDVAPEKAKSFLFTIGYRKSIDEMRKKSSIRYSDSIPEPEGLRNETRNVDLKKVLHRALSALPEMQRKLVLLRDYEGYGYDELAEITGLNAGQVKINLFRARTTLKNALVSIESTI